MELAGLEPVTSCLQTVVAVSCQPAHLQRFWVCTSSFRTGLVYRILRIVFGRFGRRYWLAAFCRRRRAGAHHRSLVTANLAAGETPARSGFRIVSSVR